MFAGHHAGSPYHRVTTGLMVSWSMAKDRSDQSVSLSAKSANSTSGFWQRDHDRLEVILATIHPPQEVI